jgi:hypothetical protein
MLWFGTQLQHSWINPNQVHSSGLKVHDNPFATSAPFGIELSGNGVFIPFDTMGTIMHFESHVPNDWEKVHLPILPLFPDRWDPNDALQPNQTRNQEEVEMKTIKLLMSGLSQCTIMAIRQSEANSRIIHVGEVETELAKISSTFNHRTFCDQLISSVNIATTYCDDMDQQVSSIITNTQR